MKSIKEISDEMDLFLNINNNNNTIIIILIIKDFRWSKPVSFTQTRIQKEKQKQIYFFYLVQT